MPGGPTILVVDDELASRIALRKILTGAGYQFVEASTGAEALERMSAQPYEMWSLIRRSPTWTVRISFASSGASP